MVNLLENMNRKSQCCDRRYRQITAITEMFIGRQQGPDLQNILRLSCDYRKFIARSTYDSDLKRAEISLRNIVGLS